ncbi:MAG: cyclodeaminase/cyclohydrolase family protein [Candidatus Omnitrophica bacterium]|nr:cyclodeaminase/cyclohydrolase family protein [Candidatus Omnitrophota bacterium]
MYINQPIKKYLSDLAARIPTPGGGSVAALCAALASSLAAMTCRFTLGKEEYKKFETRLTKILNQSLYFEKRFASLVDEDVRAYASGDLDRAIQVPAEVCSLSYDLMKLIEEVIEKGNKRLVSDAALAAILAESSFIAGYLYIQANLKLSKGGTKRHELIVKKLRPLKKKMRAMRKKIEGYVGYSA